jgi:ankyrin repeat protein
MPRSRGCEPDQPACLLRGFVLAQAVRALLQAGADATAANQQGSTAVHLAAVNGKQDVCKLLAERCPQVCGICLFGQWRDARSTGHAAIIYWRICPEYSRWRLDYREGRAGGGGAYIGKG